MVGAGGEPWLASFMGKIFKIGTVHDMTHSRPLRCLLLRKHCWVFLRFKKSNGFFGGSLASSPRYFFWALIHPII